MAKYVYKSAKLYGKMGYSQVMPTLEITVTGADEDRTFYLQPFRNYSFQFSGTEDGGGDHGSSGVIAESLSAIAQALSKDSAYYVFSGLIYTALSEAGIEGVKIPSTCLSSFGNTSFRDFINECIAYSKARHGLSSAHDPYEFGMEIPNYNG